MPSGLRADYPASAAIFDGMAPKKTTTDAALIDCTAALRRPHPADPARARAGYYARRPDWLVQNLSVDEMRDEAEAMERQAERVLHPSAAATHLGRGRRASFWATSRRRRRARHARPSGWRRSSIWTRMREAPERPRTGSSS
jgi:hypothetical protein